MKKIILGLLLVVSSCLIGCYPPPRHYPGNYAQDRATVDAIDKFIAFQDIERRDWTRLQAYEHMKKYRQLFIEYVLVLSKTDQKKVAINLMTKMCGTADGEADCNYIDGYESCSYKYIPGDVVFNFVSKAGELSCINLHYGTYKLGIDGFHGYALLGTRVQNQCMGDENKYKFMEEFEEK